MNKIVNTANSKVSDIHELLIFNRGGICLYHHDLNKSKETGNLTGLIDADNPNNEIL